MRAAREFGLTPGEYVRRTTHREHAAVLEWMEAQWNLPDRTDHYLAGVIREIRQIFAGNKVIPLEDCKIKFKERVMIPSADGNYTAARDDGVDSKPWLSLRPEDDPERQAHEASRRPRGVDRPQMAVRQPATGSAGGSEDAGKAEKERIRRLSEEAKAGWFAAAGIPVEMAKSPPRP